jgi:hypothetical protein
MYRVLFLALIAACGKPSDPSTSGTEDTEIPGYTPVCGEPGRSTCGDEASILRGTVRLADGFTPSVTAGTLVVTLTHSAYAGDAGGGYHIQNTVPEVDLSKGPAEFELDMCDGGVMWSPDNGEYGLVAVIDGNNNNAGQSFVPDVGEPATRYAPIRMACGAASPCLDIVLSCDKGLECIQFEDAPCQREPSSCTSDYAVCE